MELVEGQPLSDVLRATLERGEWFPAAAAAQIALEIGDALDAMHALGLIHRDVKPANILLDRERDRAVLVDVGVAVKAGNQSDAAGTPGFAAPESFLEQEGGSQTDVRCGQPRIDFDDVVRRAINVVAQDNVNANEAEWLPQCLNRSPCDGRCALI